MLKTQVQILLFFKHLRKTEEKLYLYIVDTLSSEYGWTIEYIQNLTMFEVLRLLKAIRSRNDNQDQVTQINVNKGMAGKISSNLVKNKEEHIDETKQLERLAKMLKEKTKKVKK